uniref:Uncharacterized protein n=1 Tax=Plectus sambesii TaxID=2011161 RepID=A0A914W4F4_9BILA
MSESFALSTSDDADNDLTTVATKMRTAITITGTVTERIVRPAWKVERAKILQKRFPKEPRNRTSQALVMDQYFKLAP